MLETETKIEITKGTEQMATGHMAIDVSRHFPEAQEIS